MAMIFFHYADHSITIIIVQTIFKIISDHFQGFGSAVAEKGFDEGDAGKQNILGRITSSPR